MARSKIDETFDPIDVLQYAIDELVIVRRSWQNCWAAAHVRLKCSRVDEVGRRIDKPAYLHVETIPSTQPAHFVKAVRFSSRYVARL